VSQHLHWRDLRGGLIAVGVITVIVLGVLLFARVGALHGKKVTLYVAIDEAPGILAGTEVWLGGNREGTVKDVTFRPPTTDTLQRLLIVTEFLTRALPSVRRDSYAQLRPSGTLIGAPIVYISPGTISAPGLKDGDTIYARPMPVAIDVAESVGGIGKEFTALGSATGELARRLEGPDGTIGAVRANGLEDLPDVKAGMSSLGARASGNGTIGRMMRGNLMARASRTMAAADSIRRLVSSNRNNLGRFRRDTTLVTKAGHVLAELDSLSSLFKNPVGNLGRAVGDSTLAHELDRERVLMRELINDVKQNPGRYFRL
jgi:hypothetical protein